MVHWNPPVVSNGVVIRYTLYIGYENGSVDVFHVDWETTSYNITNLNPYEQISVNVTASTHAGEGPNSVNKIRTAQAGMCNRLGVAEFSNSCVVNCTDF